MLLEQPFEHRSLYALRAALEAHAVRAGLSEGRAADLVLIVHELATNVILHGSGAGHVIMTADGDMLSCDVIDPDAAAPDEGTPAWRVEPGHGLWIAHSLSDRYTAVQGPGGTTVTVGFSLPLPGPPPFLLARYDEDGRTTLRLSGPLDQESAAEVAAAVRTALAPERRLVLDLSGMTGWDSSGIVVLVMAQLRVEKTPGATMTLTGLPTEFRRRLDSLSTVFLHYD
ncbi:ATP-binding protein [Nonomuraea terrae]|uniref:ATP-binding protein n=1 Tax=Nonomuraea terrae TaxID=2530383 RepID=UPI0037BDB238